jgi:hypothetical protein
MKTFLNVAFLSTLLILTDCTSGKKALEKGDYYAAVSQSVVRLRQNPDHKKSKEVLRSGYSLAIDYLETDSKNQLASNANFKWKSVVNNYTLINNLYEQIRTSPGALKIIPNPVNKYHELSEVKSKAAEETYDAGIEAMLKNTREDAKRAYFLFSEAENLNPGYRESIEMIEQSKFNATLKVIVEPTFQNYNDWNFEPVVFGASNNPFVKFYSPKEAQDADLPQVDQFVKVVVNGYSEGRPTITQRTETYKDSVKVSEKTVNNQKVPVYEKVTATMTIFEKSVTSRGSITLYIKDARSNVEIRNSDIISQERWSDRWATCTGDQRALSDSNKRLCGKKEPYMNRDYLRNQNKRELDRKLASALSGFYRQY